MSDQLRAMWQSRDCSGSRPRVETQRQKLRAKAHRKIEAQLRWPGGHSCEHFCPLRCCGRQQLLLLLVSVSCSEQVVWFLIQVPTSWGLILLSEMGLQFCRGPAPLDPGNSKWGRHRRGSGNNCLIKRQLRI